MVDIGNERNLIWKSVRARRIWFLIASDKLESTRAHKIIW